MSRHLMTASAAVFLSAAVPTFGSTVVPWCGVDPASADPKLSRVSHTGKHRIPILYEREVATAAPSVS